MLEDILGRGRRGNEIDVVSGLSITKGRLVASLMVGSIYTLVDGNLEGLTHKTWST